MCGRACYQNNAYTCYGVQLCIFAGGVGPGVQYDVSSHAVSN